MNDLNPAVERALDAAGPNPTVSDWLRVLLADDEGRPATLLGRAGLDSAVVLTQLPDAAVEVDRDTLLRTAREQSVRLIGDPSFTTDFMLLAALMFDPMLAESLGVRLEVLEYELRSPLMSANAPDIDQSPQQPFLEPDVTDRHDAARILDASLNRAREALRVLEDFARFIRGDALLTEELKSLRHDVADLGSRLPLQSLLAARDTPGDIGTAIEADGEYRRESPAQVAAINCRRLQEALRSIEEYGKLFSPFLAREIESVRYRAYTLERSLLGGGSLRERLAQVSLYVLLSGETCTASLDWTISEAAAGGAGAFQLREKHLGDRELLKRAQAMREWTREAGALFIVNDRPDIARLSQADGVHLGQDDLPVAAARRILGPGPLIGVSTHTLEQVRQAVRDGADYIGIGPCFPSTTKAFQTFAGLDFIREACQATSLPAFALGGINPGNAGEVVKTGARRIAVSAAIAAAEEPRIAARQLLAKMDLESHLPN